MLEYSALERALIGCGVESSRSLFDELIERYGDESRCYHNVAHLENCLALLAAHRDMAVFPERVEIALWFHDAVYASKRNDNEEESAALAERYLTSHGAHEDAWKSIVSMVLATKSHHARGNDEALMIDIDLSILGASSLAFEDYDAAIRREFQWVPDTRYRGARAEVLQTFLLRETIFLTQAFRVRYEVQARTNLTKKIAELGVQSNGPRE